jgi:hypothetical protein
VELLSNTHLLIEGDIQAWLDVSTWPNSTLRQCPTTPYESKTPVLVFKKESLLWTNGSTGVTISGACSCVHSVVGVAIFTRHQARLCLAEARPKCAVGSHLVLVSPLVVTC